MPDPAGFTPLEHWRRRTRQYVAGLLQRVDELSVSDYPAATPNQVIAFLQDLLSVIGAEVEKAGNEDKLRILSQMPQGLGMFVQWLDNAHTGQTPRGLVQLLKHMMDGLTPNSRVVACPTAEYNYSILDLGAELKRLVEILVPLSKQPSFEHHLAQPIKLILFPRIERDNVLTHAIFGHELGHPIATEFLTREEQDPAHDKAQTSIQQQIDALISARPDADTIDAARKLDRATKVMEVVLQVRKRALEELISDAVGILLFGPSALFAMHELLWVGNWDSPPKSSSWYPPSRMRIRLALKLLDELGWPSAIEQMTGDPGASECAQAALAFMNEGRTLAGSTTDQAAIEANPVFKIAYDWMGESLAGAVEFAKQRVGAVAFNAANSMDVPGLVERLHLGVPPNELGNSLDPRAVDYRSALLAAWMFKLRGIDPSGQWSAPDTDRLNQNTLRAIEYILLQDDYRRTTTGVAA